MFTKSLSALVACSLMMLMCTVPASAATKEEEKQRRFTEEVRAGICRLGVGEDARIAIRLRDKTKLKGYVSDVGDGSFVITNVKTGVATTVDYPDVAQVKGNNLATGWKIAIGVGIGVGVVFIIIAILLQDD
jgi:hypothetical protein